MQKDVGDLQGPLSFRDEFAETSNSLENRTKTPTGTPGSKRAPDTVYKTGMECLINCMKLNCN